MLWLVTTMSGIEVAGLVLGSFPIILNCIEYYRKGFEPLEEWWNFRTSFIEFVYDFEQQQMLYRENLVRLLDPVIADNSSLHSLLRNAKDPRWTDGSLDGLLEQRLAGEHKRFLWIVHKMEKDMQGLKKLLRIDDSIVSHSLIHLRQASNFEALWSCGILMISGKSVQGFKHL